MSPVGRVRRRDLSPIRVAKRETDQAAYLEKAFTAMSRNRSGSSSPRLAASNMILATVKAFGSFRSVMWSAETAASKAVTIFVISSGLK